MRVRKRLSSHRVQRRVAQRSRLVAGSRSLVERLEDRICLSDMEFGPVTAYPAGGNTTVVAYADLNGDGLPDLLASSSSGNVVSVLRNTGFGAFSEATTYSVGSQPQGLAVGDFNEDGQADFVTANSVSNNITIRLGHGDGTFGVATAIAVGAFPYAVGTGDFNADGADDIAVTNSTSRTVSVLISLGNGTFNAPVNYNVGWNPRAIAVGDLNMDGKLDLAVGNQLTANVNILIGVGNGTFTSAGAYSSNPYPMSIAIADFNEDGRSDLAAVNYTVSKFSILLNGGGSTFGAPVSYASATFPFGIVAGDFNQDGNADVAVVSAMGNVVEVFPGHGDGTVGSATVIALGSVGTSIASADFDGDGELDLVTSGGNELRVMLNSPEGQPVVADAGGPYTVVEGGSVTLTGAGSIGGGLTYAWDLDGDGVYGESGAGAVRGNETGVSPTFSAVGLDGPSTVTIGLRVTDSGGQTNTDTGTISITNVAPALTISGNAMVAEGSSYTLNLSSSDPGTDTIASWTINWGDGSSQTVSGHPASTTHTYADNGSYTITATAGDEDGGPYGANSKSVTVTNVAPTIALSGGSSVNEGSTYTLTLGAIAEPGTDTVTAWTVYWGDGTSNTYTSGGGKTHTYTDGPLTANISVTLTDEDGAHGSAGAKSVAVVNVPPTVGISGAGSATRGTAYTLDLSSSDVGADGISSWSINWGDGGTDTTTGSPASVTHTYNSAGSFTINASAVDGDGGPYSANSVTVVVTMPGGPTLVISGNATLSEGASYALGLSSSGPVNSWLIDWGDNSSQTVNGNLSSIAHTYADNGGYTIAAYATDANGTYAANSKLVSVTNVVPTIVLSGNSSINEGATYALTLGSITDPGSDTVTTWIVSWGDGTSNTYTSGGAKTHPYGDGPLTANITVSLVDEDGTHANAGLKSISVVNVAPTVVIGGDANVNEGSTYALGLSSSGPVDYWVVHWGDTNSQTASGSLSSITHKYADNGSYSIIAYATDGNGTYASNGKTVAVANVSPSISAGGASSVNEGSGYTLMLGGISEPGADTVTAWIVDWGDGASETCGSGGAKTHTYADGPGVVYVVVSLVDEDGTHNSVAVRSVNINDVPPTLRVGGLGAVYKGVEYVLSLSATDVGNDTVGAWSINWGDGTADEVDGAADSAKHVYLAGGTYTVLASAVDEDGRDAADALQVAVNVATPTAVASITGAPIEDEPAFEFTVTFTDEIAMDLASIDGLGILVTGPNDYSERAEIVLVESMRDQKVCTATYQAPAPSGAWTFADNGTYTISVVEGQIRNMVGEAVPAGVIGTFEVAIDPGDLTPPVAGSIAAVSAVTGGSTGLSFKVTYTDETRISEMGLGDGNILVTGPRGFAQLAALVSAQSSEDGTSRTATYRISAPGGFWDPSDNGVYGFALRADQVFDDAGNYAAGTTLGVAMAKLAPDRIGTTAGKASLVRLPTNGAAKAFAGYVMGANKQDYFRFVAGTSVKLTTQLSGLLDKAQVQVLNGKGQVLRAATKKTAGGTYFVATLAEGNYLVRVVQTGTKGTWYRLQLSALSVASSRVRASAWATPISGVRASPAVSNSAMVLGRGDGRFAGLFNQGGAVAEN